MEQSNGETHRDRSRPSLAEVFRPVATAPTQAPAGSLDPSGIGKLVEHEVAALLQAAEAEAGRIRSKALAGVKMAEAKVASLQQQVQSTLAQLEEIAGRIEQTPSDDEQAENESVFETRGDREPVAPSIPPSAEVVRLLRENLT
jgi:hypothetical protein